MPNGNSEASQANAEIEQEHFELLDAPHFRDIPSGGTRYAKADSSSDSGSSVEGFVFDLVSEDDTADTMEFVVKGEDPVGELHDATPPSHKGLFDDENHEFHWIRDVPEAKSELPVEQQLLPATPTDARSLGPSQGIHLTPSTEVLASASVETTHTDVLNASSELETNLSDTHVSPVRSDGVGDAVHVTNDSIEVPKHARELWEDWTDICASQISRLQCFKKSTIEPHTRHIAIVCVCGLLILLFNGHLWHENQEAFAANNHRPSTNNIAAANFFPYGCASDCSACNSANALHCDSPVGCNHLASKTLVLIGLTGSGKSSLGNRMLGEKAFVSSDSMSSETAKVSSYTAPWLGDSMHGLRVSITDTPGLGDSEGRNNEDLLQKIVDHHASNNQDNVHGFLFVMNVHNIRFDQQTQNMLRSIVSVIPEDQYDDFWNHTIIVFTHCDSPTDHTCKLRKPIIKRQLPRLLCEKLHVCNVNVNIAFTGFTRNDIGSVIQEHVQWLWEKLTMFRSQDHAELERADKNGVTELKDMIRSLPDKGFNMTEISWEKSKILDAVKGFPNAIRQKSLHMYDIFAEVDQNSSWELSSF